MRVIAGSLGGRRLITPSGSRTRPTSELVRGAMFNSLVARGEIEGAVVADLFAGSGALGIEALSRGAAEAVFVDSSRAAVAAIDANLASLGLDATVIDDTVERWVGSGARAARALDVVLADPPYDWDGWNDLLGTLATLPARLVVAEAAGELAHPAWRVVVVGRYGDTVVTQLAQRGAS
ncbi:MAG: RsmD family RNA methyltransferase [Acidimicrobiales bacterium]